MNGRVQSAVSGTTGISTQQKTFWPRGSRYRPVEGVSDPLEDPLERAAPNEAGKLIREDEKPLLITAWGDVTEKNGSIQIR